MTRRSKGPINDVVTETEKAENKRAKQQKSINGEDSTVNSKNTRINRLVKQIAVENVENTGKPINVKKPKRVNRAVASRETEAVGNPTRPKKNNEKIGNTELKESPKRYTTDGAEELFIQELIRGSTQIQAYRLAYPKSRRWKENSVKSAASKLFNNEMVQARYNDVLRNIREKETKQSEWTRDTSRNVLEDLVNATRSEMDRIALSYENEAALNEQSIDVLQKRLDDDKLTQKERDQIHIDILTQTKRMIQIGKERRISAIHVDGIVKPVTEINRMFGFNEDNLDMNQVVVFVGEELIED